jgi:transcriptional regulator with XRE-family HTH domain
LGMPPLISEKLPEPRGLLDTLPMVRHRLAEVLKRRRVSKRQFAKRIGKKYENVFRYFHPGYDPKLSALAAWAKALKVKVQDLISEK